jgi:hypothetical protein
MTKVCALGGLPGGTWQTVHLFGSLAPSKSGVAVGVGLSACAIGAIQKTKENKTVETIISIDPQTRRNREPVVTVSNSFIRPFCYERTSIPLVRKLGNIIPV